MKFIPLHLKNSFLIELNSFEDKRGSFTRFYCEKEFSQIKHVDAIKQVNHSITSKKGTVRGMHFQLEPKSEIKIIKCIRGAVFDVIIDLRNNSETYLSWHGEIISESDKKMIYVPKGFAHGFQTLQSNSELLYFHSEMYSPGFESGVRFDDPQIGITWPLEVSEISEKDLKLPFFNNRDKNEL